MADPVSWRVIERGGRVLDAAGNEIGRVDRITGDPDADIFDDLAPEAASRLEAYTEPVSGPLADLEP